MTHLRYVLIMVACIGMSFSIVFAQEDALSVGTLRGQIIDLTQAQNPVEGVEVKIVAQDGGKAFITKTDADGNYKHAWLPAGRYMISISKDGYDKRSGKSVTIVEGGDHFVPLKMMPNGIIEPPFAGHPAERLNIIVKQQIISLLQRFTESVGERYGLNESAAKTFHRSILNSIAETLEQSGNLSAFAKAIEAGNMSLLEILLSRPDWKAAFVEHLSEAQLQDYLEWTVARRERDQQAVARRLTMLIDKELSLTIDQREKIVQLLLEAAENEGFPSSMNALRLSSLQAVHLTHYRLKISLDDVLSEVQSKVWQGFINTNANRVRELVFIPEVEVRHEVEDKQKNEKEGADIDKKRAFLRKEPPKHVKIEQKVDIVINEIVVERNQPWIEINPNTVASPEQMMEIAEAKLAAHTELLGPLNERAARRLALVTKGVAQQYIEAQDKDREAMDVLRGEGDMKVDVTNYPLYQQAIKDVLSEEAFAEYTAHKAEREALRLQALRDIVVACMDAQLLLDDPQRKALETAASELVPAPVHARSHSTFMFFQLFPQTVNYEVLTPWQQGEFERVFGPLAWRRKR